MSHRLSNNDSWFLAMGRVDPLAKEPFKVGDEVVVCANCKTVQLADIWNMGHQCAACGHKSQASTFTRSFIDFSYGRSAPSFLRWLQSPALHHLKNALIYILPIVSIVLCVVLSFLSSSNALEDLYATWDVGLAFILDGSTTLESSFTSAGQTLAEHFTITGIQKWSELNDKMASLNLEQIIAAIISGVTDLPGFVWNLITRFWYLITTSIMQFIQWFQSIFS